MHDIMVFEGALYMYVLYSEGYGSFMTMFY